MDDRINPSMVGLGDAMLQQFCPIGEKSSENAQTRRASLAARWQRTHLPMQEAQVHFLV